MINVGVIGCGYWGPNLIRNFMDYPDCRLHTVCDLRGERLRLIRARYPTVAVTKDALALLKDPAIDAVAISTPAATHYPFARLALEEGKHVMVEKPLTTSAAHARHLVELSLRRNKVLLVDHTFIYTGAVRKMKEIIHAGQLGQIYYFDSVRVNLGLYKHDVNVIWDLAPHDISIMDYLLKKTPLSLSAAGTSHLGNGIEDIAYLTINFPDNLIAHLHVNWLAPTKIRLIQIGGSEKMLVYNDLESSEKVKVYDKGIAALNCGGGNYSLRVQYRIGDMYAPKVDHTEALLVECGHFLDCIDKGERPISDGESGLRAVKILEAAERSIKHEGRLVKL